MFDWVFTIEGWVALVTLSTLEIVLGIDNIVFISILVMRLPEAQRRRARQIGLLVAMLTRLLLLFLLFWLAHLTVELFTLAGESFSMRDLVLIAGGMFLIWKSTVEIHQSVEGNDESSRRAGGKGSFAMVVAQIAVIDIVFSLDSVITAIGIADYVSVMAIAIIIAVIFMVFFVNLVSVFIERHPTLRVLALSFLLMVGLVLVADGFDIHVPRGYIYFSMAFSIFVEALNLRMRSRG
jgi:predicted tellurium resistance membrane protein TerC